MSELLKMSNRVIIEERSLTKNLFIKIKNRPSADSEFHKGVMWGSDGKLYTPAFWKSQYLLFDDEKEFGINYSLGENILEEIVACMLGGFGLKSELGLLAFERLKEEKIIKKNADYNKILNLLKSPFLINNKNAKYRFPFQKAKYIHELLNREDIDEIPLNNDLDLRNWLLNVKGIGMKTASWITRNYLKSESVAIIDIHIYRACQIMGLFDKNYDIQKDYNKLEEIFLMFCKKLEVMPSKMDALMWLHMKHSNRIALRVQKNN